MERTDPGLTGGVLEIDLSVRMRIDPKRGFHRAAAIAGLDRHSFARPTRDHLDKAAGEQRSDLVETDIAAAIGGCLRKPAETHTIAQRPRRPRPPDPPPVGPRLHPLG